MTEYGDMLGHVLDMLGECNSVGAVTISGMGPTSLVVFVSLTTGRWSMRTDGPTLTVALERMVRRVRGAKRKEQA